MQTALRYRQIALLWAAILTAATVARLTSWWEVFTPDRVRFLADTDPHYHVLRALRIVEKFPQIPWSDPTINHPQGAVILWPPLFDLLIAVPAKLLGGSLQAIEQLAVWVPVGLGLVTLLLVGALGKNLVQHSVGLTAAALLALLPANIEYTILGRPDQHAMELVASCWVFLAFISAWREGATWTRTAVLGISIAVAFWTWQGSGFYLVLLVGFSALWHLLDFPGLETHHPARALAQGATLGGVALGLSVSLFTPHGIRTMHIMGVTGFHVILVGITAAFSWILLLLKKTRRGRASLWRRLVEITLSSLTPAIVALTVVPEFQESVDRGLAALTASNAWYAVIHEFAPLLMDGVRPLSAELVSMFHRFGLLLLVAPLYVLAFVKRWRERPDMRHGMLFLLYWGSALWILTFLRVRFQLYAAVPLALWLAVSLEELGRWIRGRSAAWGRTLGFCAPALAMVLVLVPAATFLAPGTFREDPLVTMSVPLLGWLRGAPAAVPGRDGVLAPWTLGHAVLYFARKPVVTTPFGTDGGSGAMEDSARFFLASNADGAEFLLEQRRVGFVLLANPADEVFTLYPFSGSTAASPVQLVPDLLKGATFFVRDTFSSLLASRLYFQDGSGEPRLSLPALGGYRLLSETPLLHGAAGLSQRQIKLFGVIRGAKVNVVGARPDSPVVGSIPIKTNQGRVLVWTTVAASDANGRARLRIPYATGANGQVHASRTTVSDGTSATEISLTESEVVGGEEVVVDLSAKKDYSPAHK